MNYLTKTAPIGREATLERIIATAEKMGDRDLAAPEIAELDALRKARFAREEAVWDSALNGLARTYGLGKLI